MAITRHQREMIKLLEKTGLDETEAKRQLQEAGLISEDEPRKIVKRAEREKAKWKQA